MNGPAELLVATVGGMPFGLAVVELLIRLGMIQ
jgi:hypothetical protein